MTFKITQQGRIVRQMDWNRVPGSIRLATASAFNGLNTASDLSQSKLESLSGSNQYTQTGIQSQMRDWLNSHGMPALKAGKDAIVQAQKEADDIRAKMTRSPIDKTDVAGAIMRMEIRQWLRDMNIAKRTAMLADPALNATVALAITEGPHELSGVTREQKERLTDLSIEALHPQEAEQLEVIDEAIVAIADAMRNATMTLQTSTGVTGYEIEEAMGGLSLSDRIVSRLKGDGFIEPSEAA